jgi:Ca-activated chloride channel family protein
VSILWSAPHWLWLLLLAPLYLLWALRGGVGVTHPAADSLAAPGSRSQVAWAALPPALRALALALLVLALAGPRTPGGVVEDRSAGVPMVVALDVSSSMLAEDFRPRNRLEVAKQTIARFVAGRPDDPIGLVAFAGEAITLVPITTYDAVLRNALQSLRVGLLDDGTALGDGLAIAVDRLRRVAGRDKVIILMSDGESNRGAIEPLQAARAAAAFGIQVYTIGVGSQGVARVPVGRAPAGFRYAELPVGIDEPLLREIAELTGGSYFRATSPEALHEIYARIERLIATPLETRRRVLYREWTHWLLGAAAALLAAEWLLRGSRWGAVPG